MFNTYLIFIVVYSSFLCTKGEEIKNESPKIKNESSTLVKENPDESKGKTEMVIPNNRAQQLINEISENLADMISDEGNKMLKEDFKFNPSHIEQLFKRVSFQSMVTIVPKIMELNTIDNNNAKHALAIGARLLESKKVKEFAKTATGLDLGPRVKKAALKILKDSSLNLVEFLMGKAKSEKE
uniref:Uncharacterized protein n=1 Tax=Graphocephala atropunctata TaxID=36148 RepID=A0A1B6MCB0_9HEMI